MKETRPRRANTTNAVGAAQTLKKRFTQVANAYGSIRGDSFTKRQSQQEASNEGIGRVASVLRTLSKKERTRLLTSSKSVDEGIGTETIKPIRPASSDRPSISTAFFSQSKESISPPMETIIASPIASENSSGFGPPTSSATRRKKRRSSLSDLHKAQDLQRQELQALASQMKINKVAPLYDRIPPRPAAPAPPDNPLRTQSSAGDNPGTTKPLRMGTRPARELPPDPSTSPSPSQLSTQSAKREYAYKDRASRDRKENTPSRKPVPNVPAKPPSNSMLRAPSFGRTTTPAKVCFHSNAECFSNANP